MQFCWKAVHVFNIVCTTKFITLLTFELFQLDKYINKKGNADRFSESELTPVFMLDGVHLNVFPTLVLHFNVPLDEYFIWHLNSLFKVKASNWIIQAFLLNNVLQHFNPQMLKGQGLGINSSQWEIWWGIQISLPQSYQRDIFVSISVACTII